MKIDLTEEERKILYKLAASAYIVEKKAPHLCSVDTLKKDLKTLELLIDKLSEKNA